MAIPRRYLVLVHLLLLGLAAYWGASTVTTAIAARLTPSPKVQLTDPPPPMAQEAIKPASHYAAIHTLDIFNSTKPEEAKPPPAPVKTQLKLKLWGVALHHGDRASYAIIEDQNTHKQDLYRIGDSVAGAATLVSIEWDKVTLERDGQKEFLDLIPSAGPLPPGMASSAPVPLPHPVVSGPGSPGGAGIQQLGDHQYAIDRAEVDSALENMNQLFTQIRAVPHFEGGQSTGFRLFAIRQDSLFDRIGLKNGDIISRINGQDLNDPARALAIFQELRNEREITVEVTRNKEPLTLGYQLR